MAQSTLVLRRKCAASTGTDFNSPVSTCRPDRQISLAHPDCPNHFRRLELSADNSSIVTHSADQTLNTFYVADIEQRVDGSIVSPTYLKSYARHVSATNIQSFALYPFYDAQNPSTTVALCAVSDVPIALRNTQDYNVVHAKYPFVSPTTEAHLSARQLLFTADGSHFVAGSDNRFAVFDMTYSGQGPIHSHPLRRNRGCDYKISKGTITAMGLRSDGLLAIGTNRGEFGFWEHGGRGECIGTVKSGDERSSFTDLKFSACGRYLVTASRRSDTMDVWDIRDTGKILAKLKGRKALTSQRLGIGLVSVSEGFDVWAGGMDGLVRVWKDSAKISTEEAGLLPAVELEVHKAPVPSFAFNSHLTLLATCSGTRAEICHDDSDSDDESTEGYEPPDSSLKITSLDYPNLDTHPS